MESTQANINEPTEESKNERVRRLLMAWNTASRIMRDMQEELMQMRTKGDVSPEIIANQEKAIEKAREKKQALSAELDELLKNTGG